MNWRWKARVQNAVAALPVFSNPVYFAIQRTVGGLRPGRTNPLDWYKAAIDMVDWAASVGRTVEGQHFLEVGTGRMINVPTGLWLCGAERITTVDLNPYLSPALVAESHRFIQRHENDVLAVFGEKAQSREFQHRLQRLLSCSARLKDLRALMNIDYRSPADATKLPLPDASVDLHISYTVMEHIPPDVIRGILREARRILRPGGLLIHFIDPSDHFSHDDQSITAINFLQFSDSEWDRWAGNQFMYHNRLRSKELLALFENAGVEILRHEEVIDERSRSALDNGFPLGKRFQTTSPDELATTTVNVMGRFSGQ